MWNGTPVQFSSTFTAAGGPNAWGLPTSSPAADPANPLFVYQRFQNGIFLYDTAPLPRQYDPTRSQSLASPAKLTNTDLTDAFAPDIS
jgi:hypothetical protein